MAGPGSFRKYRTIPSAMRPKADADAVRQPVGWAKRSVPTIWHRDCWAMVGTGLGAFAHALLRPDESISVPSQCLVRSNGALEVGVFLAGKQAEILQRL